MILKGSVLNAAGYKNDQAMEASEGQRPQCFKVKKEVLKTRKLLHMASLEDLQTCISSLCIQPDQGRKAGKILVLTIFSGKSRGVMVPIPVLCLQ